MTPTPQQENNFFWQHDPKSISPYTSLNDPKLEEALIPDDRFKWFSIVLPYTGDTELEKQELRQAIETQAQLGIIQIQKPPQALPMFQTGTPLNFTSKPISQNIQQPIQAAVHNPPPLNKTVIDNILFGKKRKLGPNDPCHCGSSRKYKKCHGPREL